jgi:hypothetical protein
MLSDETRADEKPNPLAPKNGHFPDKAKEGKTLRAELEPVQTTQPTPGLLKMFFLYFRANRSLLLQILGRR